jgi:hypothetical protein
LRDDWGYCPKCGARRDGDPMDAFGRDLFSEMFGRMRSSFDDFEAMNKRFEKDFEALDLSPLFRRTEPEKRGTKPVRRGFTVKIRSGTGMEPKVSVRTFGNVDRDSLEKEIGEKFGVPVKADARPVEEKKPPGRGFRLPSFGQKRAPKVTEEPSHEARRVGDKFIFEIRLPGVKSEDGIEIKELESSVEVKALAGDTAYFKILTKPSQFRLSGRSFQNGLLRLEFS